MPLPVVLYIASILGAIALLMMLPKRQFNWKLPGFMIGAAALGGAWLALVGYFDFTPFGPSTDNTGIEAPAFGFHYIFSTISIAASAMVITNKRPVYAALWFVMVVLSSAGLFLTLAAEFIAFAMVIIYGGAILVTYMFVIMLASEQQQSTDIKQAPEYERLAREPLAAVAAGFFLLAVLLSVAFEPMQRNQAAEAPSDQVIISSILTDRSLSAQALTDSHKPLTPEQAAMANGGEVTEPALANSERVGLDLFRSHPLGLELAGIILLVALIGAVVIAKTKVPGEGDAADHPSGPGGATAYPTQEPGPHSPEVVDSIGSGMLGG